MASIDLYVHGRGRGHATRSWDVATRLERAGDRVRIFAGRDAAPAMRSGWPVHEVESLPPQPDGRTPVLVVGRVAQAARSIRAAHTDVVVSDGDLPALLAARMCRVPSVAVGHGLVFARCRRPQGCSRRRWWAEGAKARLSSLGASAHVAVNFAPARPADASTVVARPSVRAPAPAQPQPHVLCYFRDGDGEHAVRVLVSLGCTVQVYGEFSAKVEGAHHREFCRDGFWRALSSARAVVASAGSQLISECAAVGVPIFAIYKPDDDEQALNVSMLKRAGLGDGARAGRDLDEPIRHFLHDAKRGAPRVWDAPDVAEATEAAVRSLVGGS